MLRFYLVHLPPNPVPKNSHFPLFPDSFGHRLGIVHFEGRVTSTHLPGTLALMVLSYMASQRVAGR